MIDLRDALLDATAHVIPMDDGQPIAHRASVGQTGDTGNPAPQTERMRVQLRFEIDAYPDEVWAMLHDPVALQQVAAPLLELEPVGHRRFPPTWTPGDHLVRIRLLGILPVGDQRIRLSTSRRQDARILEDSGGPISGALGIVSGWRHRMAVSPLAGGRTLYRDRLDISAGALTPLVWIGAWVFWQYRAARIRRVVAERR